MAWACNNQLGRRNLTDAQKTYLIGKRLDNEKAAWGGQIGNKNAVKNEDTKMVTPFSGAEPPRGRTAERLAQEYGVGQGGNTNAGKRMDKTYPIVSDSEKPLTTIQKIAKEHNIPEGTMKKNIELGHGISKGEEMVLNI